MSTECGIREWWMAYSDVFSVVAISEEEEASGAYGGIILNDYMNYLEDLDNDMCLCDLDSDPSCESCERWWKRRCAILVSYIRCSLGKQ